MLNEKLLFSTLLVIVKLEAKLDLYNYVTKSDLKMQQVLIHPNLLKKDDSANLKSEVQELDVNEFKNVASGLSSLKVKIDKLDIDKLETTPTDLSKLSNVVKN